MKRHRIHVRTTLLFTAGILALLIVGNEYGVRTGTQEELGSPETDAHVGTAEPQGTTTTSILLSDIPFTALDTLDTSLATSSTGVPFVEVVNSCGPNFAGTCVQGYIRIAGTLEPVKPLRQGIILPVTEYLVENDTEWYRVVFDEWLRYPDRLTSEFYVRKDDVRLFTHRGMEEGYNPHANKNKYILIDQSEQMLSAYEGEALYLRATTSTGLSTTPTENGTFHVFRKTPSRYMQGPIPGVSTKEYDLPGVPWNLYFTLDGAIIHGAYWHNNFGQHWSNGCVNLPPPVARELYEWAEVGTRVVVTE